MERDMEEKWRGVEEKNIKKISDYLTKQQFYLSRKEGRKEGRIVRIGEKVEEPNLT